MSSIITVKNLKKRIGNRQILNGIDFELESGRVIGLLGPNQSGKTTLFKTIMNICHADSGNIQICGQPSESQTIKYISYMPDRNHLFPWMRVVDAMNYYSDMFSDFDMSYAKELCSFLKINEKDKIKTLSKGMIERVLIMLTFSRRARLYLLDEPFGGTDPLARNQIMKTIFRGQSEDSTILISTHQVKDVETLLDEVIFLNQGKVIFSETAENIRECHNQSIEECYLEVFQNA